ncbi:MAG: hypothetical protein ACR2NG_05420 [Acidimicrobiia bacterium]
MTTDTQHEPSEAVAADVTVDATEGEQAKELLAKARFDAFRMVTDGRKEAESILEEAKEEAARILAAAQNTAASVVESAETEAEELQSSAEGATADATASETAVAELEEEHQQLTERVGSLRVLADQLEERFAALATHANTESPRHDKAAGSARASAGHALDVTSEAVEATAEPAASDTADAATPESVEPLVKPTMDYSPAVAAPPKTSEGDDEEDEVPVERGSFYSRRSAKLPSIGEAGGKGALDMMRAIRETFDDS